MQTNLTINGTIMAIVEKDYNNQKTVYVQFLKEDEKKGFEILKVKITVESDYIKLQQNQMISIPVNLATVNGNIYFSQCSALKVLKEQAK